MGTAKIDEVVMTDGEWIAEDKIDEVVMTDGERIAKG